MGMGAAHDGAASTGAERKMRQQAAPNTPQFLEYHFPNDFVTMFHMALVH